MRKVFYVQHQFLFGGNVIFLPDTKVWLNVDSVVKDGQFEVSCFLKDIPLHVNRWCNPCTSMRFLFNFYYKTLSMNLKCITEGTYSRVVVEIHFWRPHFRRLEPRLFPWRSGTTTCTCHSVGLCYHFKKSKIKNKNGKIQKNNNTKKWFILNVCYVLLSSCYSCFVLLYVFVFVLAILSWCPET